MTFGKRIRELRTQRGLTQPQLAAQLGMSLRTVKNYELGTSLPRTRETYQKLADFFHVNINYLLAEDESFVLDAKAVYGSRGKQQAHALVAEVNGLFTCGEIAEEDMDEMMKAIQDAYWIAKEKNRKYASKKSNTPQQTDGVSNL